MAHKALYRRFRPLTFDDVIGQDSIIQTLKSQIANNSIGHAYLFTGSRGTGKTTTSKVFARAVNCLNLSNENPCNECEFCLSAINETSMDIIEMDAASHNGVDDIRELRENVKFPPSHEKYKVMIIDEVHMLSKGAFNALLKTLEEPPAYMLFILATTEPHKVPATITSRCQRYEFKRIDSKATILYLQKLAKILEVEIEDEALKLIIRLSEGAMRDALSLLEQCLSYTGEKLTYQEASRILGKSEDDMVTAFANALLDKDLKLLLRLCRQQYSSGKETVLLLMDLVALLRSGMLLSTLEEDTHLDLNENEFAWLTNVIKKYSVLDWVDTLDGLLQIEQKIKYASQPWVVFEIQIAKLCLNSANVSMNPISTKPLKDNKSQFDVKSINSPQFSNQGLTQNSSQVLTHNNNLNRSEVDSRETNRIISRANTTENNPASENRKEQPQGDPSSISIDLIRNSWDQYLLAIKRRLVSTYALMKEVKPISYQDGLLKLYLNESLKILKPAIENPDNLQHIQGAFEEYFGVSIKVVIIDEIISKDYSQDVRNYFEGLMDGDKLIIK